MRAKKNKAETAADPARSLDRLLTTEEAAALLRVRPNTLEKFRVSGRGPSFVNVERRVLYRATDIAAYVTRQTRASTSEAAA